MKPTLIIDADDTLWENNIYYEQRIADFAELMAAQGFEKEAAERMADAVERERVPLVGYAPADDPRFIVLVKIDKPRLDPWGAEVAAPVFRSIAERLFVLLDVPPDNVRLASR